MHMLYYAWQLTFIALPLVSMGSNNAVSTAIAVIAMNTMIVAMVLWTSRVYKNSTQNCNTNNHVDT